jgi:hypothetical protein
MTGWTPERRARQAMLIRRWKPWLKAGVKTAEGKAISRMNSLKHGARSAVARSLIKVLREQAIALNSLESEKSEV